eukprot:104896-Chlamydomonas_euryale.AAC.1
MPSLCPGGAARTTHAEESLQNCTAAIVSVWSENNRCSSKHAEVLFDRKCLAVVARCAGWTRALIRAHQQGS